MGRLTPADIQERLARLNGWQLAGITIQKRFTFDDFREAMAFVNRVAGAAEAADHHPDMTINYSRVTMSLSTHSAGGLTEKDFSLARQIDDLRG